MKRRELIEHLEELLSDEFDSSELVYLTKKELIKILIYVNILIFPFITH